MARPSKARWTPTATRCTCWRLWPAGPALPRWSRTRPRPTRCRWPPRVLDQVDLAGAVVTADDLHTVKATAGYIYGRGGPRRPAGQGNRRALFDACDALPWPATPIAHSHTEVGHGRITRRTIRRPRHPAVSPRRAGVPGRTLRHRHRRQVDLRGRRARGHQPARNPGQPGSRGLVGNVVYGRTAHAPR